MKSLLRALAAIAYRDFWTFVARCGGPTHGSYIHARWRVWQESQIIRNFIGGE